VASIKRLKARSVSASGGTLPPLTHRSGTLSFACCSINMVSLLYDIVYHFWHLCNRVIVLIRSGKLSFSDRESRGILLQKTCMNHGYCAGADAKVVRMRVQSAASNAASAVSGVWKNAWSISTRMPIQLLVCLMLVLIMWVLSYKFKQNATTVATDFLHRFSVLFCYWLCLTAFTGWAKKNRTCLSVDNSAMVIDRKTCDMSKVSECCKE